MRRSMPMWMGIFFTFALVGEARADIMLSITDHMIGPGFIVIVAIESAVFLLFRYFLKLREQPTFKQILLAVLIANLVTTVIGFFFPPIRHDDRDVITYAAAFFLSWLLEGGFYILWFWDSKLRYTALFSISLAGNLITYTLIALLIGSPNPEVAMDRYDRHAERMTQTIVSMSRAALKDGRMVPFDAATLFDDLQAGSFRGKTFRFYEIGEIHHPSSVKLRKLIVRGDSYMPRLGLGKEDYFNVLLNVTDEKVLTVVWHNKGKKVFESNADLTGVEAETIHTYVITEKDKKLPWEALKLDETSQTFFEYRPVDRSHGSESDSGWKTPTPYKGPIPKAPPGRGRIGRSPDH